MKCKLRGEGKAFAEIISLLREFCLKKIFYLWYYLGLKKSPLLEKVFR